MEAYGKGMADDDITKLVSADVSVQKILTISWEKKTYPLAPTRKKETRDNVRHVRAQRTFEAHSQWTFPWNNFSSKLILIKSLLTHSNFLTNSHFVKQNNFLTERHKDHKMNEENRRVKSRAFPNEESPRQNETMQYAENDPLLSNKIIE